MAQKIQLGSGINQPVGHMLTIITPGDLRFEAGYLIGECPSAEFDGPVPVRIRAPDAIGRV